MDHSPQVTVFIPGPLRERCGGAAELSLEASTVRAVLERLEREHAELHRGVCDETGRVRRHINVFVNRDNVKDLATGLDTALNRGDLVTILPAVSGG
jgi:sulfur-carrier protein